MFIREREVKGRTDVNYCMAGRLGDMVEPLNQLARMFNDDMERNGQLTRDDGPAATQTSTALMYDNCNRYNLYVDSEKEGSHYLYYLLRAFEQKRHIDFEGIPQMFQSGCRKKEGYLTQPDRSLGRAIMDLSWKNRFPESRDAVIPQLRELSMILEGLSHQIDRVRDIMNKYEYVLKKYFERYYVALDNLLLLKYESGQREAFLTARTANGRCITFKGVTLIMGEVTNGTRWSPAKDSRSIVTEQYETMRFLGKGGHRILYGASRILKKGEKHSGDNYTFCRSSGSQVAMSLSDGMGSKETVAGESKQVVELMEQLLEIRFPPGAALKLMNTVLLLVGPEQYLATLDLSCIDLHTSVLEAMKLRAVPAFIIGEERVEIMEAGEVLVGVLSGVEPVLMSRKLREGDQIATVNDGVLDALPGDDKEQAMQQCLESVEEMGPQESADQVLNFAVSLTPVLRDDMTVLTAGIWKGRSQFTMTGLQGGTFTGIL